jgi:hypothetical protein
MVMRIPFLHPLNVGFKKIALAFIFLVTTASAYPRSVHAVHIESVGQYTKSARDEKEECKKFRPTKSQVIRFFNRASSVESRILLNERFSTCVATGSVRFDDGTLHEWVLYSSGAAILISAAGETVDLLYKRNTWNDPWSCTYGPIGDEC